jgi:RNA polymerase sigma-70 factor (ECF subfamily)
MSEIALQAKRNGRPARREDGVIFLGFPYGGSDEQLVVELQARQPVACAHFFARFAQPVRGLIFRILGPDAELDDTVQDVFVRAIESITRLRDPLALRAWVLGIAVKAARIRLQARKRRRWLSFLAPAELPEVAVSDAGPEEREALRALARILDQLPTEDRIAVVLRIGERMTLPEAAASCGVSLSTFKRRFSRGERRFRALLPGEPSLRGWWQEGDDGED